jgi:hypothetical protein
VFTIRRVIATTALALAAALAVTACDGPPLQENTQPTTSTTTAPAPTAPATCSNFSAPQARYGEVPEVKAAHLGTNSNGDTTVKVGDSVSITGHFDCMDTDYKVYVTVYRPIYNRSGVELIGFVPAERMNYNQSDAHSGSYTALYTAQSKDVNRDNSVTTINIWAAKRLTQSMITGSTPPGPSNSNPNGVVSLGSVEIVVLN